MKALKITLSGTYRTDGRKRVDYQDLTGYIPFVDEDIAASVVRNRYAKIWLSKNPEYKERFVSIRETYIDSIEECEHDFSYVGKSVKELSYEEIQDLATAHGLRRIPHYKDRSLVESRRIAYVEYSNKLHGTNYSEKVEGFSLVGLPNLIANDSITAERIFVRTNEEVLSAEETTKSELSLEDLRTILDQKGIQYHHKAGWDKLYSLAFPN